MATHSNLYQYSISQTPFSLSEIAIKQQVVVEYISWNQGYLQGPHSIFFTSLLHVIFCKLSSKHGLYLTKKQYIVSIKAQFTLEVGIYKNGIEMNELSKETTYL